MIIKNPSFEIMDDIDGFAVLSKIEAAYRVCYMSEKKGDSLEFIKGKIKIGHLSPLEHQSITVKIETNRGVTHELVRHRICSFSQSSTRYCNFSKDKYNGQVTYIKPPWVDDSVLGVWLMPDITLRNTLSATDKLWYNACIDNEQYYLDLIDSGWTPEKARDVLNNSLATTIIVTANLREWRHIFSLRAVGTTGTPHPEIKQIMEPLLEEFKRQIPAVFDDIEVK